MSPDIAKLLKDCAALIAASTAYVEAKKGRAS